MCCQKYDWWKGKAVEYSKPSASNNVLINSTQLWYSYDHNESIQLSFIIDHLHMIQSIFILSFVKSRPHSSS